MLVYHPSTWSWTKDSKLCILTGAGVSAESGVKTFRDSGGLWEGHSIEEVATPEGFHQNPSLVINFYNQRRAQLKEVQPNSAHIALGKLKDHLDHRLTLITQNVDDLHERGGAASPIHMHGELKKIRCQSNPTHIRDFEDSQDPTKTLCPQCSSIMRPHIVWFGEIPFDMELIESKVRDCTHFVFIGTSSQVYPAAGYKNLAKAHGARVLNINLDIDHSDPDTDFFLQGPAGETVPKWVDSLLASEDESRLSQ
jgi:NAD-dependent deacetylase